MYFQFYFQEEKGVYDTSMMSWGFIKLIAGQTSTPRQNHYRRRHRRSQLRRVRRACGRWCQSLPLPWRRGMWRWSL